MADDVIRPQKVSIHGKALAGVVSFEGRIKHGKGTRPVGIEVEPETILKLAAMLLAAGYQDDSFDGKSWRVWHSKRAVWFLNHGLEGSSSDTPVSGSEDMIGRLLAIAEPRKETS